MKLLSIDQVKHLYRVDQLKSNKPWQFWLIQDKRTGVQRRAVGPLEFCDYEFYIRVGYFH